MFHGKVELCEKMVEVIKVHDRKTNVVVYEDDVIQVIHG